MRSEVIYRATEAVDNKYELCQTVSKAARRLHIETQEMNQTINNAFVRIAAGADLRSLPEAALPRTHAEERGRLINGRIRDATRYRRDTLRVEVRMTER